MVLIVSDLDSAQAGLAPPGFHFKNGRRHASNLQNRHIRFRDGTGVELMTVVGAPHDANARDYARLLADHPGGALGLDQAWVKGGPGLEALLETLGAVGGDSVQLPDGRRGRVWALSAGSLVLVPMSRRHIPRPLGILLESDRPAGVPPILALPGFWIGLRSASVSALH